MTFDATGHAHDARPHAIVAAAGDRTTAFRRARRHTAVVKTLRFGLPVATVLLLSSYGLTVRSTFSIGSGQVTTGPVKLSTEDLTMETPRYQGFNKDGSTYVVSARSATQDLKRTGPIRLVDVDGVLRQEAQGATRLKSPRGTFDDKTNILVLQERVEIDGDNGLKVRMTEATLFLKEHKVVSTRPVVVDMPSGQVRGNAMELLQDKREVTFTNGAAARLKPGPKAARPAAAGGTRAIGASDAPIDVTSRSLYINDTTKIAIFRENVQARQGDATLASRELEAHYDGQPVAAGGTAQKSAAVPGASGATEGGKLRRLVARSDVVLTQGADRVTSQHADFDAVNETAVLTGNVVMTSQPDRQATSDRADLNSRADTALLTGNVVVTQGRNILKGQRLHVDRKAGTTQLTSPAEPGRPAGRIFTRLFQGDGQETARARPPAPKATAAPPGAAGGFTFKTDPNAPIDIDADTLNASDAQKTATYRGHVKAVQGEFTIQTDELTAVYTGTATMAGPSATPADPAAKQTAQLQKVLARKNVVVTSVNDQSATGEWADFDIKTNTVVLGGNVVVKQGQNVMRGPKLVINMTTGISHLESPTPAAWSSATLPSTTNGLPDLQPKGTQPQPAPPVKNLEARGGGCPPDRMCAVIVNPPGKGIVGTTPGATVGRAPAAKPAAGAASSWDSTTAVAPGPAKN